MQRFCTVAGCVLLLSSAASADLERPTEPGGDCAERMHRMYSAGFDVRDARERVAKVAKELADTREIAAKHPHWAQYIPPIEKNHAKKMVELASAEARESAAREAARDCIKQEEDRKAHVAWVAETRDKYGRDTNWMRVALSASICQLDMESQRARKELAHHLAHPTLGDDYHEATRELRVKIMEAGLEAKDLRSRLRGARMAALPCAGEVRQILHCLAERQDPACSTERMQIFIALLEEEP